MIGGVERVVQAVSERLVRRGHDVSVLTFDAASKRDFHSPRGAGLPARERLNGVRIIRVSPTGGTLDRVRRWWLRQPGGWRTTQWFAGDETLWAFERPSGLSMLLPLALIDADVITSVNWGYSASFWACPRRRLRRRPRVAVPVLHTELPWAHNPVYTRMFGNCEAAIVFTDAERDFVQARGGREIAVAGAGVDPQLYERREGARIRARYGIGDRPVVGFVGRQETTKGAPTLIEAMRVVWRHVPDAVLLMAGQRAHREERVATMLGALSAADRERVVLIDDFADDDGPSILDACDLLALPSVEESFGMVMIEAWMCGKPVVGADIPSTRCIIEPGVDGFVATPFDSGDLAEKILDLLADPIKRARFGARGRAKVLSRYTWDRVTDVWEATLQKAAAR
jgi:glycosyltransferase involved in cell wall biosynthesis